MILLQLIACHTISICSRYHLGSEERLKATGPYELEMARGSSTRAFTGFPE